MEAAGLLSTASLSMRRSLSLSLFRSLAKADSFFIPSRRDQILCKPKIMPLKSITLEKLEEMQKQVAEFSAKETNEGA